MIRTILISAFILLSWPGFAGESSTTTIRDAYGQRLGSIYCPGGSKTCTIRDQYGQRLGSLRCDRGSCTIRNQTGHPRERKTFGIGHVADIWHSTGRAINCISDTSRDLSEMSPQMTFFTNCRLRLVGFRCGEDIPCNQLHSLRRKRNTLGIRQVANDMSADGRAINYTSNTARNLSKNVTTSDGLSPL